MKKYYLLLLFFTSLLGYSQVGALQGDGSRAVTITQPKAIEIEGTTTDATGFNVANGQIIGLDITGGTPNYSSKWTKDGNTFNSTDFSNLLGGEYIVSVTDSKGCSNQRTFNIGQPKQLETTITGKDVLCKGGTTGSLSVIETKGGLLTSSYTYIWYKKNADLTITDTGKIGISAYGLGVGVYKVLVSDNTAYPNTNKAWSNEFSIGEPLEITLSVNFKKDVSCYGGNDGIIKLNITGGTAPYNVSWNDGPVTKDRTNLSGGIYKYTVTDANVPGCSVTGTIPIIEPKSPLIINPITQTQPTSPLTSDGTIKITASGGTLPYTYVWTKNGLPYSPTTDIATGITSKLDNGRYQVVVSDDNGCTQTSALIMLEALAVALLDKENINCKSEATGSITVKAIGGSGSGYTYQWYKMNGAIANILNGETNSSLTNREFGTYRIIVKDGVNPDAHEDYELTEPVKPLSATFTTTSVNCAAGNDGTALITAVGGTPDNGVYNYIWYKNGIVLSAITTASSSTLSAGVYKIIIKDKLLCRAEVNFTLTAPLAINIPDAIITKVTIFGQSTGAIALDPVTGGNGGYTYKWTYNLDPLYVQSTKDISGLKAGTYTVEVRDAKAGVADNAGCIATRSFTVTQNPELLVTLNETKSIQCNGDFNGEIKANVIGGVLGYTYQWSNSKGDIIGGDSNTISNLGTEQYKVIVTDSQGAQTTSAVLDLIQPDKLVVSLANKLDVLCFGNETGIINIDVIGGTKPYTFEWKKDNNAAVYATTEDLTTLKSGIYSVYISDKNNCQTKLENSSIVQPDAPLAITDIEVKNLSGFETKNGSIEVSISGGTINYTYAWRVKGSPTIIGNAKLLDQLTIGTYELTVTDSNNCTIVKEYSLIEPDKLLITGITQTVNIKCFDNKQGVLQATITGGAPIGTLDADKNYIYKWYNQLTPTVVASTTNPSDALLAGTYLLEVSDGFGNSFTSNSVTITQPDLLKINYTQTNVSCNGQADGAIAISISGGVAPYTIVWSTGTYANQNILPDLLATTYNVTVTDNNLCVATQEVIITEPQIMGINVVKTPPSAIGIDDASIEVTVTGGTPNYNFKWYDHDKKLIYTDDNKKTNSIYNIYVGQYFITITDANGCKIVERDLDQIDPLLLKLAQINIVKCQGDATASIKAITSGGLPGYYYEWYNKNDSSTIISELETMINVKAGTYYVIVTDSFGKSIQSETITIAEPSPLTGTLSSQYTRCGDGNDWTITSTISEGTAPYTYLWSTKATTANLIDVIPGNYTLLTTDKNGCTVSNNITVVAPTPLATSEIVKIPTCYGGSDASIELTSSGGQAPYTYLWDTGEKTSMLNYIAAGTYVVIVTDSKNCVITKEIVVNDPPKDSINIGEDMTLCIGQSVTINAAIDDNLATYSWTSDQGFISDKPLVTITKAATYSLVVTNKLGCQAFDSIKINYQDSAIESVFAVSSQVFVNESFVMVDISNPKADSIEWILPAEAIVTVNDTEYAEMSFSKPGEYPITLITRLGNCTASQTKKVLVVEGEYTNPDSSDLQKKFDMKIYPNPSNGIFTVDVTLDKIMSANVKIYNLVNNVIIDSKFDDGKDAYEFNFNLNGLTAGVYFVLFESQQGSKLRKIIIQ
ncbi:T9SS type A sorting domain-containing protein [Flavobacterium sp. PL002]|uniref:T9SS type A sorting domain-containing protein n=1 Tax=Flavobacterium sp. PL002 TaxID=1897058 RepID=UPI001787C16F|nr:T9SS type A sorting domain-containing protein [Flavobacterium sp. PL002]MBE0391550.1 hypothetical protein [Flavobacterium sp. PL002]